MADSEAMQKGRDDSAARPRRGRLLLIAMAGAIIVFGVVASQSVLWSTTINQTTGGGSNSTGGGPALMNATCSSLPKTTSGTVEHVASGGNASHAYFLIVESDPPSPFAGINGSYYVTPTTQWPTMNVKVGQVVSIHVINCASSESHGFQISHYDDINKNLISVGPGQSYDVTFTADKAGTFRVYCGIFCSIHPLMQNGALVVS